MKTREWIRAELRNRLPNNEPMPPFTAVETLLCDAIDRLVSMQAKQSPMKPHEIEVMEAKGL